MHTNYKKYNPVVFAIILHYLNESDTSECIESLLRSNYKNLNLVIVDNFSPNNSLEVLKSKYPGLTFLQTGYNKGNAGGLNVGIKYAIEMNADLILLSDNDMVYTENFMDFMLIPLLNNSNVGVVSPKILYKHDENIIYCAGGEVRYLLCGGVTKFHGKEVKLYGNTDREITLAEGCCFLVKSEVINCCGLLDEKFFMYFEDVEFSERIRKKYKIFYTADSIVYHKCGAGLNWEDFSSLYNYYYTRNRFLVFTNYSLLFRIYVLFFSTANMFAKSIVLIKVMLENTEKKQTAKNSLLSLWKGYKDGVKSFIKKKS